MAPPEFEPVEKSRLSVQCSFRQPQRALDCVRVALSVLKVQNIVLRIQRGSGSVC
jgi:hypothetical protein